MNKEIKAFGSVIFGVRFCIFTFCSFIYSCEIGGQVVSVV